MHQIDRDTGDGHARIVGNHRLIQNQPPNIRDAPAVYSMRDFRHADGEPFLIDGIERVNGLFSNELEKAIGIAHRRSEIEKARLASAFELACGTCSCFPFQWTTFW